MKRFLLTVCLAVLLLQACIPVPEMPAAVPTDQAHKSAALVVAADLDQKQEQKSATLSLAPTTKVCARVTASQSLHLRTRGDTMAPVIGYLYNSDQVTVIDNATSWWKVETEIGTGYANSHYLQTEVCDAK
jgi:hypothetical protein